MVVTGTAIPNVQHLSATSPPTHWFCIMAASWPMVWPTQFRQPQVIEAYIGKR
jgi:hypothetical protein